MSKDYSSYGSGRAVQLAQNCDCVSNSKLSALSTLVDESSELVESMQTPFCAGRVDADAILCSELVESMQTPFCAVSW